MPQNHAYLWGLRQKNAAPPEVTTLLAWGHELVDDTCESEIVAYHRLFTVAAVGFIAGGALTIQTPVASAALYVI